MTMRIEPGGAVKIIQVDDIHDVRLLLRKQWMVDHPLLAATKLGKFIIEKKRLGMVISFDDSEPSWMVIVAEVGKKS